ncbi:MAG: hypothetical protein IIC67_06040 [Thaumarchaeota archaeon]|nr:hypothetical protein [Nitrososphaerota archaeon]
MAEQQGGKPKWLKFKVSPRHAKRPRSGTRPVTISGTIYTGGDKGPVDATIIHPKGRREKMTPIHYARTGKRWIVTIGAKYGVTQDHKLGLYKVRAVIRKNKKQIRVGYFTVTRN